MESRNFYITILVAILAILASKNHFLNPSISHLTSSTDLSRISSLLSPIADHFNFGRHHRHKPADDKTKKNMSICDNFPSNFPPPDTNTTSYICVDRNGCCNFTTVQAAVDTVANFSQKITLIWINTGFYYEKVIIPKTKPNITLQGQGFETTTIAWNNTANSTNGTFYCGSVQVFAANFVAKNISFMNVAPSPKPGDIGAQAVAIRVSGDQSAFWGCGFFGAQDTLHDDRGRHYFKDCYIQGSIDFIFGNARSLYQDCQLISMANPVALGSKNVDGAVTAHGRATKDENSGFVFVNCTLGGTGRVWLGRAWRPFARVIFAFTTMTDIVAPEGWNDFNDPSRDATIFYSEYNCSGAGANLTMRPSYVQRLNETQASVFLNTSFIDGDQWLLPYDN